MFVDRSHRKVNHWQVPRNELNILEDIATNEQRHEIVRHYAEHLQDSKYHKQRFGLTPVDFNVLIQIIHEKVTHVVKVVHQENLNYPQCWGNTDDHCLIYFLHLLIIIVFGEHYD